MCITTHEFIDNGQRHAFWGVRGGFDFVLISISTSEAVVDGASVSAGRLFFFFFFFLCLFQPSWLGLNQLPFLHPSSIMLFSFYHGLLLLTRY